MSQSINKLHPGPIILFGSGETLPSSGPAYDFVAKTLSVPLEISILETPAGFQVNSEKVAQNVADFIAKRLSNHNPHIMLIPARAKGTISSPDSATTLNPMLSSNWVFMGPGSPTYTIRQLSDSLALKYLYALHARGAALTLSSAAVLAISTLTLPIYEIFKVGEDLHWVKGLDFLGKYGLGFVCVPHWNNQDGGKDLDTSRCYMGLNRFEILKEMLDLDTTIVGIDEQTALCLTFDGNGTCKIFGKGNVTIINNGGQRTFSKGDYNLRDLGLSMTLPSDAPDFINFDIEKSIDQALSKPTKKPSLEIQILMDRREAARKGKNWVEADKLRLMLEQNGWKVEDTINGPALFPTSTQILN